MTNTDLDLNQELLSAKESERILSIQTDVNPHNYWVDIRVQKPPVETVVTFRFDNGWFVTGKLSTTGYYMTLTGKPVNRSITHWILLLKV